MAKVADVKLKWKKSPSLDITKVDVVVTVNGTESHYEVGPEVEDFTIEVKANSTVQFYVAVTDADGLEAFSTTATFGVGDLENPQPATDPSFEIVGIREVPDEPTPA